MRRALWPKQVIKLLFRELLVVHRCRRAGLRKQSRIPVGGDCRRMSEYIRPQGLIRYKPYVFTCPRIPFPYVRYYMPRVILRELSGSWSNLDRIVTRVT